MDHFPLMLYRFPAQLPDAAHLQDGRYDTVIVHSDDEVVSHEGWSENAALARKAHEDAQDAAVAAGMKAADPDPTDDKPPTRTELEQKATELGVTFDGRTSDKTLAKKIAEAIAAAQT